MSFLFEGRKGFILLNDNKVIRLDEKRKCCVKGNKNGDAERKGLINIIIPALCGKVFRKKKEKTFTRRDKGEKVHEGGCHRF
jgi:hypothetical protein